MHQRRILIQDLFCSAWKSYYKVKTRVAVLRKFSGPWVQLGPPFPLFSHHDPAFSGLNCRTCTQGPTSAIVDQQQRPRTQKKVTEKTQKFFYLISGSERSFLRTQMNNIYPGPRTRTWGFSDFLKRSVDQDSTFFDNSGPRGPESKFNFRSAFSDLDSANVLWIPWLLPQ